MALRYTNVFWLFAWLIDSSDDSRLECNKRLAYCYIMHLSVGHTLLTILGGITDRIDHGFNNRCHCSVVCMSVCHTVPEQLDGMRSLVPWTLVWLHVMLYWTAALVSCVSCFPSPSTCISVTCFYCVMFWNNWNSAIYQHVHQCCAKQLFCE